MTILRIHTSVCFVICSVVVGVKLNVSFWMNAFMNATLKPNVSCVKIINYKLSLKPSAM